MILKENVTELFAVSDMTALTSAVLFRSKSKGSVSTLINVFNLFELIFLGISHASLCRHARKQLEINLKTARCST